MKGAALLSLSFLLCFSCTGGKGGRHVAAPAGEEDFPLFEADTLVLPSEADADTLPAQADELFDDFIFNYASNARLQLRRTVFPLPYYKGNEPLKIEKEDWAHDSLFVQQTYYTLLFDNEDDMDLVGDTTLKSVQVEWFFLDTREVKRYYFERKQGTWMLEAINLRRMQESGEEDFLAFYARFAADSLYQRGHLCDPLPFVTIDPDDEFSILETTLDVNQWFAFRPQLPVDKLSNINYGQRDDDASRTKILKINGIGNGYSVILYFRKRGGEWTLYRYEDTGV